MRKTLKPEDLGDLLDRPILAILSTNFADGTTLLSPLWHEWRDGGFNIVVWSQDIKSRHLQRNPRATILVAEHDIPYRGMEVRGETEITVNAEVQELALRLATRYLGIDQGKAYADENKDIAFDLIRLEPGRLRAWDFNDEW